MRAIIFFSQAGCLLPLLIVLNLFFGWLVFPVLKWLIAEAVLVLLYILNSLVITRRIIANTTKKGGDVIDVQAERVDEKQVSTGGKLDDRH